MSASPKILVTGATGANGAGIYGIPPSFPSILVWSRMELINWSIILMTTILYQPPITAVADALVQRGVHFRAAVHNLEKAAKTHPYNTPKAKDLVELVHVRIIRIIRIIHYEL